ncbi:putative ribonuclease H-like domain-containing protein [Tanacetum coccineum]|uniref:Ribonuclease H-like domain-containing protein n=1 Tax=Tanacetum coccineum TaxID=301880 RepID=A0ABQ5I9W4_9ASTR
MRKGNIFVYRIINKLRVTLLSKINLPPYDDSSKNHDFTFSNPLFDIDEDFTLSDESFSEEDIPKENFIIFSNPLFDLDEEIASTKVDRINDEVLESIHSIPPGIDSFDAASDLVKLRIVVFDPEGAICFWKGLALRFSSPRPPEALQALPNAIESLPPSISPLRIMILLWRRSGYHQKDRKPSQNDKTEHGMEKTVQNQGQSPKMPKSESILKNQHLGAKTITALSHGFLAFPLSKVPSQLTPHLPPTYPVPYNPAMLAISKTRIPSMAEASEDWFKKNDKCNMKEIEREERLDILASTKRDGFDIGSLPLLRIREQEGFSRKRHSRKDHYQWGKWPLDYDTDQSWTALLQMERVVLGWQLYCLLCAEVESEVGSEEGLYEWSTYKKVEYDDHRQDLSWIEAMHNELLQFKLQKVWTLVDLPYGKRAIGTKWVYRNKKDERGIVVRNKARLVTQGFTQEEGIDYDEVFAPVARIEAIRVFLAYASFKDFVVYQMDVKSALLYGKIEEEVYVCQPPGFEDPEFPDRVYNVEKVLYGLHQAPRAWYETLSTYLLDNGFQRGQIDKTLFIKRVKDDILLVQVYVDDIIFGSIRKELCTEFEKMMHKKFQISSMGELTFFLGLQVTQKNDGIFISQDKYVDEILKKFGFSTVKTASTPMETLKPLMRIKMLKILISWQCKKQTMVANSTTKAEYVAAASCYVKNPMFHSKTKHIEIRHHFIRDSNEKKLVQMIKIHTDQNVADILTKAFDVGRFQYPIASIGMLNL